MPQAHGGASTSTSGLAKGDAALRGIGRDSQTLFSLDGRASKRCCSHSPDERDDANHTFDNSFPKRRRGDSRFLKIRRPATRLPEQAASSASASAKSERTTTPVADLPNHSSQRSMHSDGDGECNRTAVLGEKVLHVAQSCQKITLQDLAKKLQVSENRAEDIVADMFMDQRIRGHIDRQVDTVTFEASSPSAPSRTSLASSRRPTSAPCSDEAELDESSSSSSESSPVVVPTTLTPPALPRVTSASHKEGTVTVRFAEGDLGFGYCHQTGEILKVIAGQAKSVGVQAGWRMIALDSCKWNDTKFRFSRRTCPSYEITFWTEEAEASQSTSAASRSSPRRSRAAQVSPSRCSSSPEHLAVPTQSRAQRRRCQTRTRRSRRQAPAMPSTGRGRGRGRGRGHLKHEIPESPRSGESRFPNVAWAEQMVDVLAEDLHESLLDRGLGTRPLHLGTDCSGAEAPVFALKEISQALAAQLGVSLAVDHLFSCDVDFAPRTFIRNNCEPRALFADLLARARIAHCLLEERPRMVPGNLDVYVAGFPCKDFSQLNRFRPGFEGPNAKVFHGVVDYIKRHEPRTFILENVQGIAMSQKGDDAPICFVIKMLRGIPGYQVHYWKVNTQNYYLPQHRVRVYIVGVHTRKARLKRPLQDWEEFLQALEGPPQYGVHDYMLPDQEPEVSAQRRHQAQSFSKRKCRFTWKQLLRQVQALPRKRYGLRWMANHVRLRQMYGLGDEQPLTHFGAGWTPYLSARIRDTLELCARKIEMKIQSPAGESSYAAEISRGINYSTVKENCAPTITPTTLTWVFCRWRWLIGVEKLALQGFPVDDLDLAGLKEADIQMLAGNAMSVPVVGALLLLVLALVEFPD